MNQVRYFVFQIPSISLSHVNFQPFRFHSVPTKPIQQFYSVRKMEARAIAADAMEMVCLMTNDGCCFKFLVFKEEISLCFIDVSFSVLSTFKHFLKSLRNRLIRSINHLTRKSIN